MFKSDLVMRKLFAIVSVLVLCLTLSGQTVDDHKNRKARLEREIEILDKQIAANANKRDSKLSELELVRKKVSNRKALLAETDAEINAEYNALVISACTNPPHHITFPIL